MQGSLQWVWAHCWVVRHRGCEKKGGLEDGCPASACWGPWLEVLAWKPWEAPGFSKAVGKQGRDVVCAGDDRMWTILLGQGVGRGGLLLALGTAFTGSSAKSRV